MCSANCKKCRKPPPGCARCCAPSVSNCIFDLESAVFDTRHLYQRACIELAASYNREIPANLLLRMTPMETQEMAELICKKCKIPLSWEIFLLLANERTAELVANPPLMPGVEKLIRHLDKCCIRMALITSCRGDLFLKKIRGQEELFEYFSTILCSDDPDLINSEPKPQPDVLWKAMYHMGGASPDCTLLFDGTFKGLQAAQDARMPVVMTIENEVPCFWSELATLRLESLEDFDPELFGIPPFECDKPPPSEKSRTSLPKQRKSKRRGTGRLSKRQSNKANEAEIDGVEVNDDEGEEEEGEE